jgi:antitoxin PrlF
MMIKTEDSNNSDTEIVAVTKHGQATIPKKFREQLGIEAPGKVRFRETPSGEVVVEQVRSPREMRGFASRSQSGTERPATEILREKREQDRAERDGTTDE